MAKEEKPLNPMPATPPEGVSTAPDSTRRSWKDRLRERKPDIDVDDELAVGDYLGDAFSQYDDAVRQRDQFNQMLTSDPNSAGILTGLATGVDENGEPFSLAGYLYEKYGDIIRDYEDPQEALRKVKEREAELVRREADKAKRDKQINSNIQASDEALLQAMDATNADEKTVSAMLEWIFGPLPKDPSTGLNPDSLRYKVLNFTFSIDDWMRLIHAFTRDESLQSAREEGRRTGIRSRPGAAHRRMSASEPTDLGGGGGSEGVPDDQDPTLRTYSRMGRRF